MTLVPDSQGKQMSTWVTAISFHLPAPALTQQAPLLLVQVYQPRPRTAPPPQHWTLPALTCSEKFLCSSQQNSLDELFILCFSSSSLPTHFCPLALPSSENCSSRSLKTPELRVQFSLLCLHLNLPVASAPLTTSGILFCWLPGYCACLVPLPSLWLLPLTLFCQLPDPISSPLHTKDSVLDALLHRHSPLSDLIQPQCFKHCQ